VGEERLVKGCWFWGEMTLLVLGESRKGRRALVFQREGGLSSVERGKWLGDRDWRGRSIWVRAAVSLLGMGMRLVG